MSTADIARDRVNILLRRGDAIAQGTREQGAIRANAIATIGDVATHLPAQLEQARAEDRQRQIADIFKTRGSDLDGAIEDVTKIDPKVGLDLRQRKNAADKAAYDYKLAQHEGALKNVDFMARLIGSAKDQGTYTQALYTAQAAGLDVSKLDPTYNADFVETLNRSALTARERLEMSKPVEPKLVNTVNDAGENVQRFVTPKAGEEYPSQPPKPAAPRQPPAPGSLGDYITKEYGDTPTAAEILKGKTAYTEAGQKADGPDAEITQLTPAGLDLAALQFKKTGNMPAFGFAKNVRQQIINRAATLTPEDMARIEKGGNDVAYNAASYKADRDSLAALQKQTDAVTAFESTATKNIDMFLAEAGKVVDTGSPLANQAVRSISGALLGSKDQAGFDAARVVALTETSRVLNNPNLTGVVSDSARHEIEGLSKPGATLKQAVTAMRILKKDMDNRRNSNEEQIGKIKGRISANGAAAPTTTTPPTMPPAPAGRRNVIGPDGKQTGTVPVGTTLPAGWRFVD